jgi:alpha-ketoglutarate-dependent 2,4-dichlorophenoxyacetate dioxygenase
MSIAIRQLHPTFAGEVSGVDLTRPLQPDEVAAIESGMDRYAVLVFHDQRITDDQQIAFSANFGEIQSEVGGSILKPHELRLNIVMADISNLDVDDTRLARTDRRRLFGLSNRLWHSDSSFRPNPAKYSMLSGRAIPSRGGNTEFADMRAAYDALDASTKAQIEDLVCEHCLLHSRGLLGYTEWTPEERAAFGTTRQRLVRTHPVTGRKSLFLSSHANGIVGWLLPEARIFLHDLTEHATQREFVQVHEWRQYDLVMWDNRQTMHRGRHYDDMHEVRDMRRTSIVGDGPTIAQVETATPGNA